MSSKNIRTVELSGKSPDFDTSFFDKQIAETEAQANAYREIKEIIDEAIEETIVELNLNNISFRISNEDEIIDEITNFPGAMPIVEFSGETNKYAYYISISPLYDEESDDDDFEFEIDEDCEPLDFLPPESTSIMVSRVSKNNALLCDVYNFDTEKWEPDSEYFGPNMFTKNQMLLLTKEEPTQKDTIKQTVLYAYIQKYATISDDDLEDLFESNEEILNILDQTMHFLIPRMLDEHTVYLCLSDYPGAALLYQNGTYKLCDIFNDEVLADVYHTEDEKEFLLAANMLLNREFKDTVAFVVPISKEKWVEICTDGNAYLYAVSSKCKKELTKIETIILKKYTEKINEWTNKLLNKEDKKDEI